MVKQLKRFINYTCLLLAGCLVVPALASAHVIVTPSQAGVAEELVFNVSSPNEQQTPIVKVVLDIPAGVSEVIPTVVPGWTITTTTSNNEVASITWSGGQIPVGQRMDFGFGAQMPGNATTLDWKAYQTYADGTVVHWDRTPTGSDDATGNAGPYSETKVVDDLNSTSSSSSSNSRNTTLALVIACVALIIAVGAWLRTTKKN